MSRRLRVLVVSPGFDSPNGRAFLFPLLAHESVLRAVDVEVTVVADPWSPNGAEADVIVVDSKRHRARWASDGGDVLRELAMLRQRCEALLWFDTSDSSGNVLPAVLPHVTGYYKSILLRDRSGYLRPMYGRRPHTDYYHRTFSVEDADLSPWSEAVPERALLDRLAVSWSSALADYSLFGPARMAAYGRVPRRVLLRYPGPLAPAFADRGVDVSCRMGTSYSRATVAQQRRMVLDELGLTDGGRKLGRWRYFREMKDAKVVISPFGWGEITLKDFEAFLCGSHLLKPAMGAFETYPDLFVSGETISTHRWDVTDIGDVLGRLLDAPDERTNIAAEAQERYLQHLHDPGGEEGFATRFRRIVELAVQGRVLPPAP